MSRVKAQPHSPERKVVSCSRWWAKQALLAALLLEVYERHSTMVMLGLLAAAAAVLMRSCGTDARRWAWHFLQARQPNVKVYRQVLLLVFSFDALLRQPGVTVAVTLMILTQWLDLPWARLVRVLDASRQLLDILPTPRRPVLHRAMFAALALEALGSLSRLALVSLILVVLCALVRWRFRSRSSQSVELMFVMCEKMDAMRERMQSFRERLHMGRSEAYIQEVWRPSDVTWAGQMMALQPPQVAGSQGVSLSRFEAFGSNNLPWGSVSRLCACGSASAVAVMSRQLRKNSVQQLR
ncbi:unnamed protein product [Symbiodinium pilosum]|uniref:Uncharacterized protein n=1 Tax=Symbiodinium pilosum TaxID=2952 RepID=A0A812PS25_SYMPI|nr:unnamed protein product [Symbiodinium pilosum]